MAQLVRSFSRFSLRSVTICRTATVQVKFMASWNPHGHYSKKTRKIYRYLWEKRELAGPEKERHRSEWLNWNRDAELYAFGKRLGEEFSEASLTEAFVDSSYVEQQKENITKLQPKQDEESGESQEESKSDLIDNTNLSQAGEGLGTVYIKAFLRHSHPALPEEGISSICDYLMSDASLAHVGRNLGISDLILCDVIQPSDEVVSKAFKAVLGALSQDQGAERAHQFVQDFIITQLIGKDINELWNIVNPMGLLEGVLAKEGRESPEPRLLGSAGSETVEAAYFIGLYSEKQLVGKGYGETLAIAEEMAAREALREYFGTKDNRTPYAFETPVDELKLDMNRKNISELEYMQQARLQ